MEGRNCTLEYNDFSFFWKVVATKLEFEENGKIFNEDVNFDEKENTVLISVPETGKSEAAQFLYEYDSVRHLIESMRI